MTTSSSAAVRFRLTMRLAIVARTPTPTSGRRSGRFAPSLDEVADGDRLAELVVGRRDARRRKVLVDADGLRPATVRLEQVGDRHLAGDRGVVAGDVAQVAQH